MAFTCFPIIVFAVYDQEYLKSDLLAKPALYSQGLRTNYLDWSKYFWAMFEAMFHGLLVFMVAYWSFDESLA